MRIRFASRSDRFFPLFSRSADNLVSGATLLGKLVHSAPEERGDLADRLKKAEEDGDDATHRIMNAVNSAFITPFDREDVHRLASSLDDVMDAMEEAGALITLYRIAELPDGVFEQVHLLCAAAALTADAVPGLAGVGDLAPYWIEITRLENVADQVHRRLLSELFANTTDDPITVFKLKEVIDQLEVGADAFEKVAHTVESIAVKDS